MKRTLSILLALLLTSTFIEAQQRTVERIYLSTDRNAYVAGDHIWLSAFCVDAADQCRPSRLSRTAYIELHADGNAVQTAKIALDEGRGACRLEIPKSVPTGNYTIIAYTQQNLNEENWDFMTSSKVVSVFNTLTTQRVKEGVEVVDATQYEASVTERRAGSGDISITTGRESGKATVTIENAGEPADVSISVFCDDGIADPDNESLSDFIARAGRAAGTRVGDRYTPEYEGEIIRARVVCPDSTLLRSLIGRAAYISTPGDLDGMHLSLIEDPENIEFYTGNIYGMRDMLLEIAGTSSQERCHLELKDKFANPILPPAPALKISKSLEQRLERRSVAMQQARRTETDSLFEHLPYRSSRIFEQQSTIRYVLDDYTRFPLMEELFIEFIKEAYADVQKDGSVTIMLHLNDTYNPAYNRLTNSLMMMDGTPIPDQSKIYSYDPLLVQYIDIYPNTYICGNRIIAGAINFITYKRNLPAMTFNDNVRIVDFKGTDYPMAMTESVIPDGDDLRQTLYWHPMTKIENGGSVSVEIDLPSYDDKFTVVVEGLTSSGLSVYRTTAL